MTDAGMVHLKLLHIARESAERILTEYGWIAPFAFTICADGEEVESMTAVDSHPDATFPELLQLAVEHLRSVAATEEIAGAALVTPMESGSKLGFMVQLQSRSASFCYLFPYRVTATGWEIDEPVRGDSLFIRDGFF